jgi:uncharacterized membrane-anchored protein
VRPAILFWLGLGVCLGAPVLLIAEKEHLLATGRVVLLPLAPVDPRSLMQGDYMVLRYAVARPLQEALRAATPATDDDGFEGPRTGSFILTLDADGVGTFARLDDGETPPGPNETRLRFKRARFEPAFGAEAFFFEEGRGEYYEAAKYGELRVDASGRVLLSGLRDADRNPL